MENVFNGSDLNQKTIFDHPSGLFVLFFTEMWERFSYYGMRAILVLFLTASLLDEGWGWERKDAMILYGWYTMLVYFTPLIGGILADKLLGYRNAVVIGAFLMALGHASLALESMEQGFFYLGLILLIAGNGLFKPNISEFNNYLEQINNFEDDAFSFLHQINSEVLLITKGADGSSMFHENEHYSIPTKAQNVHDVSGAGDTVISAFCLSDICRGTPQESAYLSNFAAGRVCEEVGVVPITLEMLNEIYLNFDL